MIMTDHSRDHSGPGGSGKHFLESLLPSLGPGGFSGQSGIVDAFSRHFSQPSPRLLFWDTAGDEELHKAFQKIGAE